MVSPMPRAKDNSRGATGRETDANIALAKEEAHKATDPSKLTALGKAFFHAQRKHK